MTMTHVRESLRVVLLTVEVDELDSVPRLFKFVSR